MVAFFYFIHELIHCIGQGKLDAITDMSPGCEGDSD